MKKVLITVLIALAPLTGFSQNVPTTLLTGDVTISGMELQGDKISYWHVAAGLDGDEESSIGIAPKLVFRSTPGDLGSSFPDRGFRPGGAWNASVGAKFNEIDGDLLVERPMPAPTWLRESSVVIDGSYVYMAEEGTLRRKVIWGAPTEGSEQITAMEVSSGVFGPLTADGAALVQGQRLWFTHNAAVRSVSIYSTVKLAQTEFSVPGGGQIVKMTLSRVTSGDETPALLVLTQDGRLYYQNRSIVPLLAPTLISSGVNDFAVREEGTTFLGQPQGRMTVYGVDDTSVWKWDYLAGKTGLPPFGPSPTLRTVAVDDKNIYVGSHVPVFGSNIHRLAWPKSRASQSSVVPWHLIQSNGAEIKNMRSDSQWLYWIRGTSIEALRTDVPALTFDLAATGLEAVQVIQDVNNSIPLIAGRSAYVRGYARVAENTAKLPTVAAAAQLEVRRGGVLIGTLTPENAPVVPEISTQIDIRGLRDDPTMTRSYLFHVPEGLIQAGALELTFTINPYRGAPETGGVTWNSNNSTFANVSVVAKQPLQIVFKALHHVNGLYDPLDPKSDFRSILDRMLSLYPVPSISYRIEPGYITRPQVVFFPPKVEQRSFAIPDHDEIAIAMVLAAQIHSQMSLAAGPHWVGMFPNYMNSQSGKAPLGGRGLGETLDSLPGFISDILDIVTVPTTAQTRTSWVKMVSGIGSSANPNVGGFTLAHEIGHNLGRFHIPTDPNGGGNPKGPYDTHNYHRRAISYTVPGTAPGEILADTTRTDTVYGFDGLLRIPVSPARAADLMTYDFRKWITVDTYMALLAALPDAPAGPPPAPDAQPAAAPPPAATMLMVQGSIDAAGRAVAFMPAYVLPPGSYDAQQAATMVSFGNQLSNGFPFRLRMLDAGGATLSTTGLMVNIAHGNGEHEDEGYDFIQMAELAPGTARVQVLMEGNVIGEKRFSANAPMVTLNAPVLADGQMKVSWTASDADGDLLFFTVKFSSDGGTTWSALAPNLAELAVSIDTAMLAGGNDCLVRLITTDGMNTTISTSTSFVVPKHAPQIRITGVNTGERLRYGNLREVSALAYDAEDGSMTGESIVWTLHDLSRQASYPSAGEKLSLSQLAPGRYEAEAEVTDSDGSTATASVAFEVLPAEIPTHAVPPVLDGIAADEAYADSPVMCLQMAGGRYASVHLARVEGRLYACITDLKHDAVEANVGLVFDLNASGGTSPQNTDRGFFVDSKGRFYEKKGNGTALVLNSQPTGAVIVSLYQTPESWNAEFCLPEFLLDGWDHTTGFAITHGSGASTTNWPPNVNLNAPGTWSVAGLGTIPPPVNVAPVALAGLDQRRTAGAGETFALNGSASYDADSDPLTHAWTRVSGPVVTLAGANAASASFAAPAVTVPTTWVFELSVTDGNFTSTDQVSITIDPPAPQPTLPLGPGWVVLDWPGGANQTVVLQSRVDADPWDDLGLFQTDFLSLVRYLETRAPPTTGTRTYQLIDAPTPPPVGLVAQEPFVYPPGGEELAGKAGGMGWTGPWTYDPAGTNAGEASATALAQTSAQSLNGAGIDDGAVTISAPAVEQVVSLTRQFTTPIGTEGTTSFFSFLIEPQALTAHAAGVRLKTASGPEIFIGKPAAGAQTEWVLESGGGQTSSGIPVVNGQPTLLVVRAVCEAAQDTFTLYVNPDLSAGLPTSGQATRTAACGMFTGMGLYSRGACVIDDLRAGTNWSVTTRDLIPVPEVETQPATEITVTTANLRGRVNPNGEATTAFFEYGTTPAFGGTAPLTPMDAGAGDLSVPLAAPLSGLLPGTTYHYRLVAENASGITRGLKRTFTTLSATTTQPVPDSPFSFRPREKWNATASLGPNWNSPPDFQTHCNAAGETWVLWREEPFTFHVGKWNANGVHQWTVNVPLVSYVLREYFVGFGVDAAGNSYVGGTVGDGNFYLVKFSPSGAQLWYTGETGAGPDPSLRMTDMVVEPSGNIIMTGNVRPFGYAGKVIRTVKCNSSGQFVWGAQYGNSGYPEDFLFGELALDTSGNVYITAMRTEGSSQTPLQSVVTLKYNSSGGFAWQHHYDPPGSQAPCSIAVTSTGRVLVCGSSSSPSQTGFFQYLTEKDLFVLSLDHDGSQQWVHNLPGIEEHNIALEVDNSGAAYAIGWSGISFTVQGTAPNTYDEVSYLPRARKFSSTGELLWSSDLSPVPVLENRDGFLFDFSKADRYQAMRAGVWLPSLLRGDVLLTQSAREVNGQYTTVTSSRSVTDGTLHWESAAVPGFFSSTLTTCADGFLSAGVQNSQLKLIRHELGGYLTTLTPSDVQATSATLRGAVNPRGTATSVYFEFGLTTAYGTTVPISAQDVGSGMASMLVAIPASSLAPNTTYHYRIVGTTALGDFHGQDVSFKTAPPAEPPLAADDVLVTLENDSLYLPSSILLANDQAGSSGLPFTIISTGNEVNCYTSVSGGQLMVSPNFGFTGQASFTYTVMNEQGGTATASVFVTVTPLPVQPKIVGTATLVLPKNGISPWLNFILGPSASAASISVAAASDNAALLPVSRIDFDGAGAARRIKLRPVCGQTGQAVITLTATSQDGLTATTTYYLSVVDGVNAQTTSIIGLGTLPSNGGFGGGSSTYTWDVSADGGTVAGIAYGSGGGAFAWTPAGGLSLLPSGPMLSNSEPRAISADGSLIGGQTYDNGQLRSFLWSAAGGYTLLPLEMQLSDLSADGATATGVRQYFTPTYVTRPIRWTAAGMVDLAEPPGFLETRASRISADGTVIVGYGVDAAFASHAVVWPEAGAPVVLPPLPGGQLASAQATSADGAVIVGYSTAGTHPNAITAVRWLRDTLGAYTVHPLVPGVQTGYSEAKSVSADGSKIIGVSDLGAFIWDATNGQRGIQDVLFSAGVDISTAWNSLGEVTTISADGRFVVGSGERLDFRTEAFRIELPHTPAGPVISPIANLSTTADTATPAIPFTLSDPDSNPECLVLTADSSNPSLVPPANIVFGGSGASRTVTVTPAAGQSGMALIVITVNDGFSSSMEDFTLTVGPGNLAPTALPQTVSTNEDNSLEITPTGTDPESQPLTFSIVTQPDVAKGSVNVASNKFYFFPEADFHGSATFTFRAYDGMAYSAPATITVNVMPLNDAPLAEDKAFTTDEDTPLVLNGLGSDVDGDALVFFEQDAPLHGTISGDWPNLIYTPDANFHGADSFTFLVSDGLLDSEIKTVTLTINPVNDIPIVANRKVETPEDTALPITLTATDAEGEVITYHKLSDPAHGTLGIAGNVFTYTPDADYHGPDSFTWKARDANTADSLTATVSITVTPLPELPLVKTSPADFIHRTGATLHGFVHPKEEETTIWFEYGPTTAYGSQTTEQTLAAGITTWRAIQAKLTGMTPGVYHFRCVAETASGVAYGEDRIVKLRDYGIVAWGAYSGIFNNNIIPEARSGVVSISSANGYNLFVRHDGSLWGWGDSNLLGLSPVGGPATVGPTQIGVRTDWKQAAGDTYNIGNNISTFIALAADGSLWWMKRPEPYPVPGQLVRVGLDNDWRQIAGGQGGHYLALKTNGTLWAWGVNTGGQLGDGTTTNKDAPVQVGSDSDWKMVAAGPFGGSPTPGCTAAIKQDGSLWAWGSNASGQLGQGNNTSSLVPIRIGADNDWVSCYASAYSVYAIKSDGSLWSAGGKYEGPPIGGSSTSNTLTRIGTGNDWASVAAGSYGWIGIKTDGSITVSGVVGFDVWGLFNPPPSTASGVIAASFDQALPVALVPASPAPITLAATNITTTSATLNGTVDPNGTASTAAFDLGQTTAYGSSTGAFNIGSGIGAVAHQEAVVGLAPHTTYHFRIKGSSSQGTEYGQNLTFTTGNTAPVFADASFNGFEDIALNNTLIANDADGDARTFTKLTEPANGGLTVNANGSFTYTPDLNWSGTDTFTAKVVDGFGGEDTATITLVIAPVNDAPLLDEVNFTTNEDTPLPFTLTATDVEGDTPSFAITQPPVSKGVVTGNSPNFIFTPAADFYGLVTVPVLVTDDRGATNPAAIYITVIPVNDPPVAQNATFTTAEDTALNNTVSGSDVDGNELEFEPVANPAHGTLSLQDNGGFTYTPAANFNGIDTFTHRILDEANAPSNTATITINVTPVNDPPVALAGSFTTAEDIPFTGALLGSDPDGDPLTFRFFILGGLGEIGRPAHGNITLNTATGAFTYTPHANYHGADEIRFQVREPGGNFTNVATVAITVNSVDDGPPLAQNLVLYGIQGQPIIGKAGGSSPDGFPVTYTQATNPSHGIVNFNSNTGAINYTSEVGYHGIDSFSYKAIDLEGESLIANVILNVRGNHGRVIEWGNLDGFSPVPAGASTGVIAVAATNNSSAALKNDGSVVTWGLPQDAYWLSPPPAAASGVTAISCGGSHFLALKNGQVIAWGPPSSSEFTQVPPELTSGVTAISSSWGRNAAVKNGKVVVWGSSQLAAVPLEAQSGVISVESMSNHFAALKSNGSVFMWHASIDSGVFEVQTGVSAISGFHTTIFCLKSDGSVFADGAGSGAASMANFPEARSDCIAIAAANYYGLLLKSRGAVIEYPGIFINALPVPVEARDGCIAIAMGGSGGRRLAVRPANDAPAALPQSISLAKNTSKVITPAGADTTNDTLTFALASQPAHGTAVANANGTFTYTPIANYIGADSFTFTASDATSMSTPGTITLNVLDMDPFSAWQLTNYGSSAGASISPTGDTDGDGRTNLEEFAFGTDPRLSKGGAVSYAGGVLTQRGAPTPVITGPPSNPQPMAVFCRRADYLASGLTYTVLFSFDLINKVPSATIPTVMATDGEIEVVAIPYPAQITVGGKTAPPKFFQVSITRNP